MVAQKDSEHNGLQVDSPISYYGSSLSQAPLGTFMRTLCHLCLKMDLFFLFRIKEDQHYSLFIFQVTWANFP